MQDYTMPHTSDVTAGPHSSLPASFCFSIIFLHCLFFLSSLFLLSPSPLVFLLLLQSLDVNQAVNNLLSRDDDGGEGGHEEGVVGFFPSGGEYSEFRETVLNVDPSLIFLQKSC